MNERTGINQKEGIQAQGDMDRERACRDDRICQGNKETMPSDIFLANLKHFFHNYILKQELALFPVVTSWRPTVFTH
jgi:hypothetical protein